MDRKVVVYSSIGLVLLGSLLFRDHVTAFLNSGANNGSPRASLQRSASPSRMSSLEKVLHSLQPATITDSQSDRPGEALPSSPDGPQQEMEPPRVLTFAVEKVKAHKKTGKLNVKGQVRGDEVMRIEVYRDGRFLYDVFRGKTNPKKTNFAFKEDSGLGIYKIRVVGSNGSVVDKWFRFLPWVGGPVDMSPFHTRVYKSPSLASWESY
jgi:hypothetical protein